MYPRLFAHARTALKFGLLKSGIASGDKVLLPDYVCDVVVHPLEQLGIVPVFYPVTDQLVPDWMALDSLSAQFSCKALVMVHYFGQPQDIVEFRDFAGEHGLLLVEDNAHGHGGFYEGQPLGTFGDIGISSPRKIIDTASGGMLFLNGQLVEAESNLPEYPPKPVRQFAKMALRYFPKIRPRLMKLLGRKPDYADPSAFTEPVVSDGVADRFSRKKIGTSNWQVVATRRREAWNAWSDFAVSHGLKPVFSQVHPESCPWALPVYARDAAERNDWLRWGGREGIPTFPWPSLPESILRHNTACLNRWHRLFCFPLKDFPYQ